MVLVCLVLCLSDYPLAERLAAKAASRLAKGGSAVQAVVRNAASDVGLSNSGPLYPRLANYNGLNASSDVPAFSHYDLVIAQRSADQGRPSPVMQLHRANPQAKILVYERTLQVDYPYIQQLYGPGDIFPGWWLVRSGSVLAMPISATQTTIPVADSSHFHRFDDVLVDAETMHVIAITGDMLLVQRGFYSKAAPHAEGVRIAAHYSYRVDLRNTILQGRHENRRPWSFNLSSACPRDAQGRTWNDYLAEYMAKIVQHGHWDGVFFDNTDEMPRDPWVDVNNDTLPDGGVLGNRNLWHEGEMALIARFHQFAPHSLVMYNGTLDAGKAANGREMEGFPLTSSLYMGAMSDYAYWQSHDSAPSLMLVNPDTAHSPRFNLDSMRFGLVSALMGDGFYSYDEGWHTHGAAWNFDEYDNGAGSALTEDIGKATTHIAVANMLRFQQGDIVLVDREQMVVRDQGGGALVVTRGVNGSTATSHPAGSVLATPQQIAEGSGYLGHAVSAAYPVLPPLRSPNLVVNGNFHNSQYRWDLSISGAQVTSNVVSTNGQATAPLREGIDALSAVFLPGTLHTAESFSINVNWAPLRKPNAVALYQSGIPVTSKIPYTLTFWAQGVPGMVLPVVLTGTRANGSRRYSSFLLTLHRNWEGYLLRYTAPDGIAQLSIGFQFGHTFGQTAVTGIELRRGQSLVYARSFEHGLALLNQNDAPQRIRLSHTYWHLRGAQDPSLNNGEAVTTVVIQPHSGMILLNAPPNG